MSLRPYHNSLALRVMVGAAGKVMDLSFHSLQLAYMAAEVASACDHDSRACPSLALESCSDIIATGVDAPLAQDENLISMLLTHKSAEAQFLGGISGVKTLVQGVDSCLACTVGWARDGKFRMIIQR
ncbi:hypothetical protein B0T17DRAFT_541768 [Bombardia bombarda]|uniref:Uncharacterized protein n=1 Tax=Bombardia bombarda TaxID=252184 RepID=A0AA39WCH9_9PEZI|nr:hypothetical protein B0T17DRAFT_541768 [Bombardia bombarda]